MYFCGMTRRRHIKTSEWKSITARSQRHVASVRQRRGSKSRDRPTDGVRSRRQPDDIANTTRRTTYSTFPPRRTRVSSLSLARSLVFKLSVRDTLKDETFFNLVEEIVIHSYPGHISNRTSSRLLATVGQRHLLRFISLFPIVGSTSVLKLLRLTFFQIIAFVSRENYGRSCRLWVNICFRATSW